MRQEEHRNEKKEQTKKYEEMEKDSKSDQVSRAFKHKAYENYGVGDYLKKVGIKTGEGSIN